MSDLATPRTAACQASAYMCFSSKNYRSTGSKEDMSGNPEMKANWKTSELELGKTQKIILWPSMKSINFSNY